MFEFDQVVFFGRSFEEYVQMFNLVPSVLRGQSVLDCCAGPSSFAMEAAERGINVVACDPLYGLDEKTLRQRVEEDVLAVETKQRAMLHLFHPELVPASTRKQAMLQFLDDFAHGLSIGRYVCGRLPALPFANDSFDTVLCANLLFIYSDSQYGGLMQNSPFDFTFHMKSLYELMRVTTGDVRVYPLQGTGVQRHLWLDAVIDEFELAGFDARTIPVKQRDIIGAEQMLVISRKLESDRIQG